MSFFDDDPFEDIMKEFFGNSRARNFSDEEEVISGEDEERNIDFIETKDKFFVVFELPGYDKEDLNLEVKGNKITVSAKKKISENMEEYMARKFSQGIKIIKTLPQYIKTKNYEYNFSNGILEVMFKK